MVVPLAKNGLPDVGMKQRVKRKQLPCAADTREQIRSQVHFQKLQLSSEQLVLDGQPCLEVLASGDYDSPKCVMHVDLQSYSTGIAHHSSDRSCGGALDVHDVSEPVIFGAEAVAGGLDESVVVSLLEQLWQAAGLASTAEMARTSDQWLLLGFQTADPTRDLRGVGVLGLRQLVHFCRAGGVEVARSVVRGSTPAGKLVCASKKRLHPPFPLAAASLNVTHMLCCHLRLLELGGGGGGGICRCSEQVIDACLQLQHRLPEDSPPLIDLLHEQMLCWLHTRWARLETTQQKLIEFPAILSDLRAHLISTLAHAPTPWQLPTILLTLRMGRSSSALMTEHCCRTVVCKSR